MSDGKRKRDLWRHGRLRYSSAVEMFLWLSGTDI